LTILNRCCTCSKTIFAVVIAAAAAVAVAAVAAVVIESNNNYNSVSAIRLTGQQFFANGTGIAYFDNGTTQPFDHPITTQKGFYYDNSTKFLAIGGVEDIPGVVNVNESIIAHVRENGHSTPIPGSNIVNVTIPSGAELLPANQTFQPNVVKVKVGDTIRFVNEDFNIHIIMSPPSILSESYNASIGVDYDAVAVKASH
jgi:hypothetical protein